MKKLAFKLCVKSYGESIVAFEQDSRTVLPTCCNGMHDPKDTEQKKFWAEKFCSHIYSVYSVNKFCCLLHLLFFSISFFSDVDKLYIIYVNASRKTNGVLFFIITK
jgi:hypothetical protein